MAQFDIHRLGGGLVLDCQSDLLSQLASRLVVPLLPKSKAPAPVARLNPVFTIAGKDYVMVTETAGAVRTRQLGAVVESLANRHFEIIDALDVLISGV
ncbi:MAG TPA: CcdB family protein [Sphingomicrobium sp.]|jgi:toxin CcdB|nr:CcdB family protein [Sphingomicrobium sp.]